MGWANSHIGHKQTVHCTVAGCKYTSRQWVSHAGSDEAASVSSTLCPKHRTKLVPRKPK